LSIPITLGSGAASIATTQIGNDQHQNVIITSSNSSVISVNPGSIATVIIGGSIAASSAPTSGSSVVQQGAWTVSVVGTVAVGTTSVLAYPAPLASLVQGTADLRVVQGASVAALSAPGANIRTYITNVQVSNFGPSSVLVKISDNTTSTLGWTIAPAGGGSNYNTNYRSAANSPITASISGTASVLVSMQGFTSST